MLRLYVCCSKLGLQSSFLTRMVSVHSLLPVTRDTLRWWIFW
ncbi:hypothetical protein GBAR_LOCUS16350 [Geodia barretti]|uniref:Uncharacterized protein n=1 Tax=Geodia barretti TaxID=519541 RepID=A0AA35SHH5_GEOBA|nr:hypothetical protein GBAR_LOCUS16350 [Geodia barretti]